MASGGREETMNILVVGNTCTGKSALINQMIGKEVAEEAADEQSKGTGCVNAYVYSVEGVTGKFWDTPGLQDGTDADVKYIHDMKKAGCHKADLMLYCIKMSNTRFQEEDRKTITNLTTEFGKEIWERTAFVLTFANDVVTRLERKQKRQRPGKKVQEVFKDVMSTWEKALSTEIGKASDNNEVAESIPVIPAGYDTSEDEDDILHDTIGNWRESLWRLCHTKARAPQDRHQSQPWYRKISMFRWSRRDDVHIQTGRSTRAKKAEESGAEEHAALRRAEERAALRRADLERWKRENEQTPSGQP